MATPLRNVRIGDDLWLATIARAAQETPPRTASDVVRRLLEQYVRPPEPNRPPAD